MAAYTYPPSPRICNRDVLKPDRKYRREAVKLVGAIGLFIAVYMLLMLLAIGLAVTVSYLGLVIMMFSLSFFTIVLGVGLIGTGLMVFYFLIKFIFTKKRYDRSGLIEITQRDYPELFDFILKLAKETKTAMPKHIYLATDINASVFYDSNFLSMFMPVRKNLLIGLGLVNSVNISEFKAVLAHEFGHFSQHSMKLGSYVFNVNKIILNLLYDNESYANTLNSWASFSSYFFVFAKITISIVNGIQWILQKIYLVVNKSELRLSRQMEYHADTVSAFVSGPNQFITSLNRLDLAIDCYNSLFDIYNAWIPENIKTTNIYEDHRVVMSNTAQLNGYYIEHGLPQIDQEALLSIPRSRIIINSDWSTHPTHAEREKHLRTLDLEDTPVMNESPWLLFGDYEKLQKKITNDLFSLVAYNHEPTTIESREFDERYLNMMSKTAYSKVYKSYYTNRSIEPFELSSINTSDLHTFTSFEEIFSDENCRLPRIIGIRKVEIEQLKQIEQQESQINTFEFDGTTYPSSRAAEVRALVELEFNSLTQQLQNLDGEVFRFAVKQGSIEEIDELTTLYTQYFYLDNEYSKIFVDYSQLYEIVSPIYQNNFTYDRIWNIVNDISLQENKLSERIKVHFPALVKEQLLDEELQKTYHFYLNNKLIYFDGRNYINEELEMLYKVMSSFTGAMYDRCAQHKKHLLDRQLEIAAKLNSSS